MTSTSSLNSIFGISDDITVMLDIDDAAFKAVKYWAQKTMRWFKLEGFIILKSSERNYHIVFNRRVTWSENMRIVAWVALLTHSPGLDRWLKMQCIKQSSTLRVSSKGCKPAPRIVYRFGKQNRQVASFLSFRSLVKRIIRRVSSFDVSLSFANDIPVNQFGKEVKT